MEQSVEYTSISRTLELSMLSVPLGTLSMLHEI